MIRVFLLLAGLALLPMPAQAQQDIDCKNPQTQMAMNICADRDYQTADEDLNTVWAELREARQGRPSWQPILDAQRLWIPFCDAHCESEAAPYEGGSIQPLIRSSCLAAVTQQRTAQLRDLLIQP
ncbi:MAG: lysozyme inhibitor LprI family protein [Cohaesibacteraceae bacterium]